jgi:hypothetical protein
MLAKELGTSPIVGLDLEVDLGLSPSIR